MHLGDGGLLHEVGQGVNIVQRLVLSELDS